MIYKQQPDRVCGHARQHALGSGVPAMRGSLPCERLTTAPSLQVLSYWTVGWLWFDASDWARLCASGWDAAVPSTILWEQTLAAGSGWP